MGSKVAVILIPVVASFSEQRLPDCSGEVVVFTKSPSNVTVICEANMRAQFPCHYMYTDLSEIETVPHWAIDSIVYGRLEPIPNHIYIPGTRVLHLQSVISQNNTVYVCEFHTFENGSPCAYRSEPGSLIITTCKVTDIRYEPYYRFKSKSQPSLLEEVSILFSQDIILSLVNDAISYTIFFSNSASDDACGDYNNITFTSSSRICNHGVCKIVVLSSEILQHCFNSTGINVTVLANDLHGQVNFSASDPSQIDVANNFVNVSFNEENSEFMFYFQSNGSEKICSVLSSPETEDCKNIQSEPAQANSSADSRIVAVEIDVSFLGRSTRFCFVANASTGSETVIVRGVYDTASTTDIHHMPSTLITTVLAVFIGLLIRY